MVRERIEDLDINEGVSNSFGEYAKYIILSRAIPDVRDGLKPVQRRILYSMYTNKLFNNKPYRKSAKTVGDVIGTLHPHGDCLRADTKVYLLNGTTATLEELYKDGYIQTKNKIKEIKRI